MGLCENGQAAYRFCMTNLFIHIGLFIGVIWYFGVKVEKDLESASTQITVVGVNLALKRSFLRSKNGGDGSISYIDIMDTVTLVLKLIGTIPIAMGTVGCVILLGTIGKKSLTMYRVFATFTTIFYVLLTVASVTILVFVHQGQLLSYIQELVRCVRNFIPFLSLGGNPGYSQIIFPNSVINLKNTLFGVSHQLNNMLNNLTASDMVTNRQFVKIQSIHVATFDAAIPEVNLTNIMSDDLVDFSNADQVLALAHALRNVDFEFSLQSAIM